MKTFWRILRICPLHAAHRGGGRDRRAGRADQDRARPRQSRRHHLENGVDRRPQGHGQRHRRHLVGRAQRRPCRGGGPRRAPGWWRARWRVDWSPLALLSMAFQRRPGRGRAHRTGAPAAAGSQQPAQSGRHDAAGFDRGQSRSTCRKSRLARNWPAAASPNSPPRDRSRPMRRRWRSKPCSTSPAMTASKAMSTPRSILRPPTTSSTSTSRRRSRRAASSPICSSCQMRRRSTSSSRARGPLANWNGIGTFMVDGQIVTQLTGRHQLTDKGNHIEAKGDGEFEPFLPENLKPLLAGKTSFDLAGHRDHCRRHRCRTRQYRQRRGARHRQRHCRPEWRQRPFGRTCRQGSAGGGHLGSKAQPITLRSRTPPPAPLATARRRWSILARRWFRSSRAAHSWTIWRRKSTPTASTSKAAAGRSPSSSPPAA